MKITPISPFNHLALVSALNINLCGYELVATYYLI